MNEIKEKIKGVRSWEETIANKCNKPLLIPHNYIQNAQPVVIIPLDEYNLLKKKVDEAETAVSYAEEVGRLLSLLGDLGGMSEKMKQMIENGKQLFK